MFYSGTTQTELGFFPKPQTTGTEVAAASPYQAPVVSAYDVVDVVVEVPEYLVVSEADVYVPQADIVWREDPLGDRKQQVKAIMTSALSQGTAPLNGPRKVVLAARVNMFHALTEKARNSVGGKHNVQFDYVLLDAETRQPVTTAQRIDASLKAYGGRKAYRAMRRGETQKVRISQHVANTMLQALSAPGQS